MNQILLSIERARQLEGRTLKAEQRRLERAGVPLLPDPDDRRRRLVRLSDLSAKAIAGYSEGEASKAIAAFQGPASSPDLASSDPQQHFEFALPKDVEAKLLTAAPLAMPQRHLEYIKKLLPVLGKSANGFFGRMCGYSLEGIPIEGHESFIRALSKQKGKGFGRSTIYAKLQMLNVVHQDPNIPDDRKLSEFLTRISPKPRPGRSGHTFFDEAENRWMSLEFLGYYLNEAKHSVPGALRLLIADINAREKANHRRYDRPTLSHCRTLLKHLSLAAVTFAREGKKKFNDRCAPYISRDPTPLRSNDVWVTDQKQVDVRLRDSGGRLGRIWMVNVMDVASEKILGYAFGPVLDSDMVMRAEAMGLARYGVPKAVYMDLGKEFICKAFNGSLRKFSGETLYREAVGLWRSLNVGVVETIGDNAQAKPIERWHANLLPFDRLFPGYCGSDIDSRPERLAAEEAQHAKWLKTGNGCSPLPTIGAYIGRYVDWVENTWNAQARGRGKVRNGMTPNEAYNVKRPAQGFRTITPQELDNYTADHRFVKVARGGQVNLTFYGQTIEYIAPELFNLQGQQVEVIISRKTFQQVTIIYPVIGGTATCVGIVKPQMQWLPENREELRAALRCKAAVSRAVREGVKALQLQAMTANPVELLEAQKALPEREQVKGQKLFGLPDPGHSEVGSCEWTMRNHRTSSAIAARWEGEGE